MIPVDGFEKALRAGDHNEAIHAAEVIADAVCTLRQRLILGGVDCNDAADMARDYFEALIDHDPRDVEDD